MEITIEQIYKEVESIVNHPVADEITKQKLIHSVIAEYGIAMAMTYLNNVYNSVHEVKQKTQFENDNKPADNLD